MHISLKQGLAALALAAFGSTLAHAETTCSITPNGVERIVLGDTFKDFKLKYGERFGVYEDPETMSKFLILFDSGKAHAAYQRDGDPDHGRAPFFVFFEDYEVTEQESNITDVRKLALPKNDQKIRRIEVRRKTCFTPEGLHPGMLLKAAAKHHGGIQQIDGAEGLGDRVKFVQHPEHLAFYVQGAIVKKSPQAVTWTTRRYRDDATITAILIQPR